MRREHKHHVVIVSFMMLIVFATFVFVILNKPAGFSPTITTYMPPTSDMSASTSGSQAEAVSQPAKSISTNIETDILIGFLIILALLFMWYLGIKIAKELRGHENHSH